MRDAVTGGALCSCSQTSARTLPKIPGNDDLLTPGNEFLQTKRPIRFLAFFPILKKQKTREKQLHLGASLFFFVVILPYPPPNPLSSPPSFLVITMFRAPNDFQNQTYIYLFIYFLSQGPLPETNCAVTGREGFQNPPFFFPG